MAVVGAGSAILAGCADLGDSAADPTLPAIQTTTIVTTTVPPTTTQPRFYEVQSGDTLMEIAAAHGLPMYAVMEANGITDPNRIVAGQIIQLPLASEIVPTTEPPPPTTTPPPTAMPVVTFPTIPEPSS